MEQKEHKTTAKGYLRFRSNGKKSLQMEHRIVWEDHFGEIPAGMQVHHVDGDKTNNDISNLQLVSPLEHKRLHAGCKKVDGAWYKPCKECGRYLPCTAEYWYFSGGRINGRLCKKCYSKKSVEDRRRRVANGYKRKDYKPKNKSLQPVDA